MTERMGLRNSWFPDASREDGAARGGPSHGQTKSSARRQWLSSPEALAGPPTFLPFPRQVSRPIAPQCVDQFSRKSVSPPDPCHSQFPQPPQLSSTFPCVGRLREFQIRKAE